jgi:cell division transport system permease protein
MTAWLARHAQTCIGTLGRLSSQRLSTLLTVLVIGIALALPASLHVLVDNARNAAGDLNRAVELSVYLKHGATVAEAEQVTARVRQRRDVASVKLIPADQALKEFRERSGFGSALDALTDNPLPHALAVQPAAEFVGGAGLSTLADELRALEGVDLVQLDTQWVERFNGILDALRRGVLVVAGLLACGVLIIVGNTIRTDIQSRRAEIEIAKLVGGSDAFVRRPFLYTGLWYGLGGGLIALAISYLIVALLAGPVRRLAGLYGSTFELSGLGLQTSLWLLGVGVGLGWLGSLIAASRHLRDIEPT